MRIFGLKICWPLLLSVAAVIGILKVAPCVLAAADSNEIPMPVRRVLMRIQPMMAKEQYAAAAEKLALFMARGKDLRAAEPNKQKIYDHYMLHFARGNCELLQAHYPQAVDAYQQAVKQNPSYAAAWLNLARANYELRRFGEAGTCYIKGYERTKEKHAQLLYSAAACFGQAGKYSDSLAAFELMMRNHAAEVKLAWKGVLVQALLALNENSRALTQIEELARETTGEGREQWQALLLNQYIALHMNTRAARYAAELTEKDPLKARWWKALAHFEVAGGNYKDALVAMTVYGTLVPFSPDETKQVADLYLQEGIPQKAALLYATILADDPDPSITDKLSRCFLRLDQPDKAVEWIDRTLAHRQSEKLLMLKGDILFELKRYKDAYAAYAAAAGLKKKTAGRAWLMMGYCALHAGEFLTAEKALTTASGYTGEKKDATVALNYLENNRAIFK